MRSVAHVVLLVLLCIACSSEEPNREVDALGADLLNGEPATTAAVPELSAVASLGSTNFLGCSASLVGERVVLTGAHCIWPVAQGCQFDLGDVRVTFADANGSPTGAGAQTIEAAGIVAHPLAYGDRISGCPDPPGPVVCPDPADGIDADGDGMDDDDEAFYNQMSCAKILACLPVWRGFTKVTEPDPADPTKTIVVRDGPGMALTATGAGGLHYEHDLALVYLERAPVGIEPLPMLTLPGWGHLERGLFEYAGLHTFADSRPSVTISGYGGNGRRDYGTTTLVSTTFTQGRPRDCAGNPSPDEAAPILYYETRLAGQSRGVPGDSGGAILFGPGAVTGALPPPSDFPTDFPHARRRYLMGGKSQGGPFGAADGPTGWGTYAGIFQEDNAEWLFSRLDDIDGDGVSNARDNCAGVLNPTQDNCNADAERDRRAEILGDACDPVPCPRFEAPTVFTPPRACTGTQQFRDLRNQLHLDTLGSRNQFSGELIADPARPTVFRFCQRDLNRGVNCDLDENNRGASQRIEEQMNGTIAVNGNPPPGNPWIGISLEGLTAPVSIDYPSTRVPIVWDYEIDYNIWVALGWINPGTPDPMLFPLSGVMGARAGNHLGQSTRPANGVHMSNVADGQPIGFGLARHYIEVTPDRTFFVPTGYCPIRPDLIIPRPCLNCPLNPGIRTDCPTCGDTVVREPGQWVRGSWFTRVPAFDDWAILDSVGAATSIAGTPALGNQLVSLLDSGARFVRAAEPFMTSGHATAPLSGLVLSEDAAVLRSAVYATASGYAAGSELCEDVELLARRSFRPIPGAKDAERALAAPKRFAIPSRIPVVVGRAAGTRATLSLEKENGHQLECRYSGGEDFVWRWCSGRLRAGDQVSVVRVKLEIEVEPFHHHRWRRHHAKTSDVVEARLRLEEQSPCSGVAEPPAAVGGPALAASGPALRDYVPVLSQTLDALFIVGGRHAGSGKLTRAISVVRLSSGQRSTLDTPGYAPEEVLAATVSPLDGALWILDEPDGGHHDHGTRPFGKHWRHAFGDHGRKLARLVRIAPISRNVEVVWEAKRNAALDRYWLTVDRDGKLLLAASSHFKHALLKLDFDAFEKGSTRVVLVHDGRGRLVTEPLVEPAGIALLIGLGGDFVEPQRIELSNLTAFPAELRDYL